ncbi:MAG: hypothetical protein F6K03_02535, partial [Kamptonema sp. SIO4C4]|nr:hypothetical protein [Kamptonema sp. SIO4C4]
DTETVYVSLLGMSGTEYGVIIYRSLDSLQRFRAAITSQDSIEDLTEAFLSQDCWFLNYQAKDPEAWDFDEEEDDLADLPDEEIMPQFGSLHPIEGQRLFLDEEEAITVYLTLQALIDFFQTYGEELDLNHFPEFQKTCPVQLPPTVAETQQSLTLDVATMPKLSQELLSLSQPTPFPSFLDKPLPHFQIRDDLLPEKAMIRLGRLSWDIVHQLRDNPKTYKQLLEIEEVGDFFPILFIQTTRPKVKEIISRLDEEGGITSVFFNEGEDPMTDTEYDLGILQTPEDNLYIVAELLRHHPKLAKAKRDWDKLLEDSQGYCGVVLAMGATGASRGNPQVKDMLAFFIVPVIDPEDIGMTPLQLVSQVVGYELDW